MMNDHTPLYKGPPLPLKLGQPKYHQQYSLFCQHDFTSALENYDLLKIVTPNLLRIEVRANMGGEQYY
jgi:hypothetical protein